MKKIFFAVILISTLSFGPPAGSNCFLSKKENSVSCSTHENETCCVIQYKIDSQTCFEAWCNDINQCAWKMVIKTFCSDPDQSDP